MVCDWYYNVNCAESEKYFGMNIVLGKKDGSDAKIMAEVRKMMENPFKSSDRSGNGRATLQPGQNPLTPPFVGDIGRKDRDGFNPVVPSFTGNGPSQGFVSGIPTRGGTIPPSIGDSPIFVSNLGELSTDPNSAFDQQKSKVISVSQDSEDPTKAAAGTQVLTYPTNVILVYCLIKGKTYLTFLYCLFLSSQGGGGSRTGRKKKGNGYEREGPKVDVNIHGFPEYSGIFGDTVNIGGTGVRGKRPIVGVSTGTSNSNKKSQGSLSGKPTTPFVSDSEEIYQDDDIDKKPGQQNGDKKRHKGKGTLFVDSDSEEIYQNNNQDHSKSSKRRPGLPKPGKNNRGSGFDVDDSNEDNSDHEENTPNLPLPASRLGSNKKNLRRPSGNFKQPSSAQQGSFRSGVRTSERDEIFNIVYSVLNERHGGLDGTTGAQRRSDNFGTAPSYEIVPSIDLSSSARQVINIPGFNGVGNSQSSFRPQNGQSPNQQDLAFRPSQFGQRQTQERQSIQQKSSGGIEIIPARLISQSTSQSSAGSQSNYFSSSSNQQAIRQRPGRRRSGPNVEIVPVPLKHSTSSSSTNLEGESTNNQPYAIPQSIKDIKASNFILNYNPLLSKPTASRGEVFVQIIKAEDTYVNDGSVARPLSGANEFNMKHLPSNFAQVQPGTSDTGAVTPFEVTGGRPSSYDVPLNSVGPLDRTRTTNGKTDSFKGYHY